MARQLHRPYIKMNASVLIPPLPLGKPVTATLTWAGEAASMAVLGSVTSVLLVNILMLIVKGKLSLRWARRDGASWSATRTVVAAGALQSRPGVPPSCIPGPRSVQQQPANGAALRHAAGRGAALA